jgi:hypothetical protein
VSDKLDTFEDVRHLGEAELHDLLERGRPEERVWAIWALALRSSDHVAGLARREEPSAGVRRNLAVLLAGHGELDLLVALARRDPAPEVRAAAMQLVARLALDGKFAAKLVVEYAVADTPEVKIAVLGVAFAGAPPWLIEFAIGLLADPDADVRYEAFEALVRAGEPTHALAWLEESPEADARIVLMRWTARAPGGNEKPTERVRACAEVLRGASRRLRRLLVESVRFASWPELSPAIGNDPPLIRAFARRSNAALEEVPTATLLRAALTERDEVWLQITHRRLAAFTMPDSDLAPLLPPYLELCEHQLAELDAQMAKQTDLLPEDIEAIEQHRDQLASAVGHAMRLMVH